jgi:glycosyltransferase involved in cell wall biosynthesis
VNEHIFRHQPRIAISTTYPESALLAIARAAQRRGHLIQLFTTIASKPWMEMLAKHTPLGQLRQPLQRELVRRSFSDLPAQSLVTVAGATDLLHRGSRLLPGSQRLAQQLEHRLKDRFDGAVARLLDGTAYNTVIAMPASAEETLRAARRSGRRGVLHLVNNHPTYRNRCLRELALVPAGHHELVPDQVSARVQRELMLADFVLVPSRAIVSQLAAAGIPSEKVVLQAYGVDSAIFHPPLIGPRPKPERPLCCLFVGSISHGKGVRFLLEAARRLQRWPVRFLLMGPLRAPELLRYPPPNMVWTGGGSHREVADAMSRADIFVMPSVEDAYPLVTLEAMATGLPVIVTNHAGTSEFITDGVDGLVVEAGKTDALVAAIQRLQEDQQRRRSIGEAARRRIENGASWNAYGEQVLDRLEVCVAPSARPVHGVPT